MPGISLLTDQALRVTADAGPTTTAPSFTCTAKKVQDGTQLLTERAIADGVFTSTTPVVVVPAYDSGTQDLQFLLIVNRDTVSHTFTLDKFSASLDVTLFVVTLAAGYSQIIDNNNIYQIDASGAQV